MFVALFGGGATRVGRKLQRGVWGTGEATMGVAERSYK